MSYFHIPKCRFFIYNEVRIHNQPHDFWIVIHGNVLDLTSLIANRLESWNYNLDYLIGFGGKDISKYFHTNGLPKMEISINTGFCKFLFPPIIENDRQSNNPSEDKFWSIDPRYHIGKITEQERPIRVINTLNGRTQYMLVCEEDTIYDIIKKYKRYNNYCGIYIWKKDYRNDTTSGILNLNCTLSGNGILKERFSFPPPSIWIFLTF